MCNTLTYTYLYKIRGARKNSFSYSYSLSMQGEYFMLMLKTLSTRRWHILGAMVLIGMLLQIGAFTGSARAQSINQAHSGRGFYQQTNLIADTPGLAPNTDPNLINPWGLVAGPTSPFWVSDNNAGVSTLYTGQGKTVPLVVNVPPAPGNTAGTPDGIVFNGQNEF